MIVAQLPHLRRTLMIVWKAAQRWTLAWLLLLVIQGLLPVANIYLTRLLVDSLVVALQKEAVWSTFQPLLPLVILMAGALLLTEFASYAASYVRIVQAELVRDHISGLIHEKSVTVDLAYYDMPEYHDRLYRAQYHALDRPLTLLENMGAVFQSALTLLGFVAVLHLLLAWALVSGTARKGLELLKKPLEAVVMGAGHCIEHYDALKGMFMGARR